MPLGQNKHISNLPPPTLDLETLLGMLVIGIAAFSADFTNRQTKETLIEQGEMQNYLPKSC